MQSILRPLSIVLLSQHHWCPWGRQHIIFNIKSTNKHCKSYSTSSTALNGGHISKQDQPRRHCYISKNYITINIRLFNPETGAEAIWSCLSIDPFSQQFSSALNESVSVPKCLYCCVMQFLGRLLTCFPWIFLSRTVDNKPPCFMCLSWYSQTFLYIFQ